MSSRSQLNASINAFGLELRSFVQRASDSITSLKRTTEQRPQAGVHDFKECLDDLEQQVADFTDEVQQLAEYTTDSISFEELIGHCSAVYSVNRATVLALEAHLGQYGYQQPPNAVQEPEGLQECVLDNTDDDLVMCSARTRQVWSTPTSPVSKGSLLTGRTAGDRPLPSRLGRSQPSSPTAGFPAAVTASKGDTRFAGDTSQLRDAASPSTLRGLASAAGMRMPLTQLRQQQQQQRTSLGSNTSSTPAGLLISPGVAALASKYATSSVGGSSVGALRMPEQQSVGGFSTDDRSRKSTCRDLNLSYGTPSDAASPDLPIFGRTASVTPTASTPAAAAAGQRWQQQQQYETPAGRQQQQQRGRSSGEDSTGELYSSLIHSNIHGMDRRAPEAGTEELDVTPPCTRTGASPCSSPQAPPTAGRLPPDWVSEKMQQLEDLQADVTLTLSQMKRCPSRSRTAPTSAAGSDDDSSSDDDEDQQPRRKPARQQRPRSAELMLHDGGAHAAHAATAQPAAAAGQAGRHTATQPAQQEVSVRPASTAVTASSRAAAAAPKQYSSSTAADSLTAAAAAASADLETLMASLSMKYALSDNTAPAAAAAAGGAAAVDQATGMDIDSQPTSPSSSSLDAGDSPVPAAGAAADSFHRRHAALPVHHSTQQQQEEEECARAGGYSSSLSPSTAQQTVSRVAALGGSAVRPQSTGKRMEPAADVHRLEDIRGFHPEHGSTLPHTAAVNSTAELHSGLPEPGTAGAVSASGVHKFSSTGSSRNSSSSSLQAAAGAERERAVLQPVQLQDHSAAAEPAAPTEASLRQSRQRQQQQHDKPKQQQATQQQQPAEALTPRAARLQRRLQQQQGHQQQQPSGTGTDQENTCPASSNTAHTAAACGDGDYGAVVKVRDISCDEFGQLPSWCKSLLSVELLNGVLQELAEQSAGRSKLGGGEVRQPTNGFTADDVATLGHSSSKSKTIVSCLHKLGRATLQRSVAGENVYKLVGSS